jgi:cyclic beta-1,2-glucan synthetase
MYRAGLEWLLGFRVRGDCLLIDPCIPRSWPRFEISFRYRSARYELTVENPHGRSRGVSSVEVDGALVGSDGPLRLTDDRAPHSIRVVLG